jgi:hypothetical protein
MYILGSLNEEHMQRIFNASLVKPTRRKDSALAAMLQEKTFCSIVSQEYRGTHAPVGNVAEFVHLPSAFGMDKPAYNLHTCFEFHRLLVGTLLGYGKALDAFAKVMNKSNATSVGNRERLAEKFFRYYRLLWRIAYSHCLIQHLLMLEAASFLRLPTSDDKEAYQGYTAFAPRMAGEEQGWFVDDNEMGDELRRVQLDLAMYTSAKTGRAKTLLGWIRHLVVHLGALDIISEFCRHSRKNIDISLISVRSSPPRSTSMSDWKATVRSLASRPGGAGSMAAFDADAAIKVLERLIDFDNCGMAHASNLEQLKEPLQAKSVKFGWTRHCEAVLASLACNFRESAPADAASSNLTEACNHNYIARDVRLADGLYRAQTRC